MTLNLTTTNLHGKIGAIICWYLDEGNMPPTDLCSEDFEDECSPKELKSLKRELTRDALKEQRRIGRLVGFVSEIVKGDFSKMSTCDIFDVWDALGTYHGRDEELESIYTNLYEEWHRRNQVETSLMTNPPTPNPSRNGSLVIG